ncbi:MAG: WYL domain-containing protein [Anaerolineae bacterium]|nr:WYL domain-containing protein [Anaerolineae bacterium]
MSSHDKPLRDHTLAVVDVETTGLNPAGGHRVCEIAIVRYEPEKPAVTLQQLVDPQRPMDAGALAVHGITPEMLSGAPRFSEIALRVVEMTQDAVVVGHNVWFDTRFLVAELDRLGLPFEPITCLDTLSLARALLELPRYTLLSVSSALGIRLRGRAHRAMADALLTWGVLNKLLDFLEEDDIVALEDILRVQRGSSYYLPKDHFQVPAAIRRALAEGLMLRLQYTDASGRTTERMVQPLRVVLGAECPSLEAYCYLRNQIRHFRLDRIIAYDLVEGGD